LIAELRWLIAHGLLHLLGWDHANSKQKKDMVAWTKRLVKSSPLPQAQPAPKPRRRLRLRPKIR
jgi:ssRNA-specific RNase YbeY (16S rRNA maturation enzyme)